MNYNFLKVGMWREKGLAWHVCEEYKSLCYSLYMRGLQIISSIHLDSQTLEASANASRKLKLFYSLRDLCHSMELFQCLQGPQKKWL